MKRMLFTPGPTEIPAEVLASRSRPIRITAPTSTARSSSSRPASCQEHLGTTRPVLTLAASGSGRWSAAVVNILSPGDEIISVEGGKFGERWGKIGEAYGLTVHRVTVAYGRVATPEEVESAIAAHPKAKTLFVTHSETSTGALFPVHDMAKAARARGVLTIADTVTSYGVYDLHFDNSDLDGVVWGSQKGMMIPPGLGYVCYAPARGRPPRRRSSPSSISISPRRGPPWRRGTRPSLRPSRSSSPRTPPPRCWPPRAAKTSSRAISEMPTPRAQPSRRWDSRSSRKCRPTP